MPEPGLPQLEHTLLSRCCPAHPLNTVALKHNLPRHEIEDLLVSRKTQGQGPLKPYLHEVALICKQCSGLVAPKRNLNDSERAAYSCSNHHPAIAAYHDAAGQWFRRAISVVSGSDITVHTTSTDDLVFPFDLHRATGN